MTAQGTPLPLRASWRVRRADMVFGSMDSTDMVN